MKYPKISIVTPSFNQGEFIEETINSILEQNYPNLEYIIIDGGSNDNTIDIIRKYSKHLAYWESIKDQGQSHAINKGLERATGEIVNWLNSDDLLVHNALFDIAEKFCNYNPDILCGYCDYFSNDPLFKSFRHRTYLSTEACDTLLRGEINQPSMFYKTKIFKDLKGVNENLHYVMDLDLFYKYLIKYGQSKILISDVSYSQFRVHVNSKTASHQDKFNQERKILLNTIISTSNLSEGLRKVLQTDKLISKDYILNQKKFNITNCIISIIEEKYFEIYKNKNYQEIITSYFKLLLNGKNVYSKNHLSVLFKSIYKSLN